MKTQDNSDSLVTMLLNKVKGGSQPDYTMVSSGQRPPLYNLAKEYKEKYPKRSTRSEIFISKMTDPTARHDRAIPKLWVETKVIIKLMPDLVLQRLLNDNVAIEYNDGTGSYYNPISTTISIKGAQDFIHEVGHHVWNTWLIRDDEPEMRTAVHNSFANGAESRKHLPEDLIPDAHKEYAGSVGAYSGQFIENPRKTRIGIRKNDLEEHFARNVDCLMRGRPLDVTRHSNTSLDSMLQFFAKHGISDEEHLSFYKHLLKEVHGEENLNMINPKDAKDGIPMTRDELFQYHKSRIMFGTGKSLSVSEQISLALDLSEDFVHFCIAKEALTEIREALKQKGITLLKI